jgi:hypothetical protein
MIAVFCNEAKSGFVGLCINLSTLNNVVFFSSLYIIFFHSHMLLSEFGEVNFLVRCYYKYYVKVVWSKLNFKGTYPENTLVSWLLMGE